jgi:3-methyladenine DNA glycosylase Mpg
MGISRRENGADLIQGPLTIHPPEQPEKFRTGVSPRIGIRHCADWPLRFFVEGSRFVSR